MVPDEIKNPHQIASKKTRSLLLSLFKHFHQALIGFQSHNKLKRINRLNMHEQFPRQNLIAYWNVRNGWIYRSEGRATQ